MSLEPMPNFNGPFTIDEDDELAEDNGSHTSMHIKNTGSSHTVGRSAHDTGFGEGVEEEVLTNAQYQRPLKRTRVESPATGSNIHAAPSGRDMMPPPSKPLSRMRTIRKIIPNLRNKLTNGRSSEVSEPKIAGDSDVQMYCDGHWGSFNDSLQTDEVDQRPSIRHDPDSDGVYMSGALPVDDDRPVDPPTHSRFLSDLGIHSNESNFTFKSPALGSSAPRSRNLPSEPSYIRLLDGLGDSSGLELGLKDPRYRDHGHSPISHQMKQVMHRNQPDNGLAQRRMGLDPPQLQMQTHQNQWNFGHAFLQQSPINAKPTSTYGQSPQGRDGSSQVMIPTAHGRTSVNPMTPAPARPHRPADEVDHVVSPFFGSSSHRSQPFTRSQFAEYDISSSRSGAYQSNHNKHSMDTDWREPRTLNGLSFLETPVNQRNERIEWKGESRPFEFVAVSPQQRRRNINSRGFLTRVDAGVSPYGHKRMIGSFDRVALQPAHHQSDLKAVIPSSSRPLRSRTARLPSAIPSTICRSSAPLRAQREVRDMPGVRGGQQYRPRASSFTITSPVKPAYTHVRRRVIQR